MILAQTREGAELGERLIAASYEVVFVQSGTGRHPALPVSPKYTLSNCDLVQLEEILCKEGADFYVEASHAFEAKEAADRLGQHLCKQIYVLRPAWVPQEGDTWVSVADAKQAAALLMATDRSFVTIGRDELGAFSQAKGRLFWRVLRDVTDPFPFGNGTYVEGRPPFSHDQEVALFERLGITTLVLHNTGSRRADTKLTAARELGLKVIMVERPKHKDLAPLSSVEDAIHHIRTTL